MVDYTRDTWGRKDRGIVDVSASITDGEVNKAHPQRLYIERLFIWLCMVITKQFGELWGCSSSNNQDYSLDLGHGISVGWGKYRNMYKATESYAEIHIKQYAEIKRRNKVRYIRKPFKGGSAYEWQIGPCVFMLYYPHSTFVPDRKRWRVGSFWDEYWAGSYMPSPLTKLVTWLSRKGEMSCMDEDASEYTWSIGSLAFKSIYDPRLNFYTITWGNRTLWHDAN